MVKSKKVEGFRTGSIFQYSCGFWESQATCDARSARRAARARAAQKEAKDAAVHAATYRELTALNDKTAEKFAELEPMSTIEKTREIQNKIDRYNNAFEKAKSNIANNIQERKKAANVEKSEIYNEHTKWINEVTSKAIASANKQVPIVDGFEGMTNPVEAKRKAEVASQNMFKTIVNIKKKSNSEENQKKRAQREKKNEVAKHEETKNKHVDAINTLESEHEEEIEKTAVETKLNGGLNAINGIKNSDGVEGGIVEKDIEEASVEISPSTQAFSNLMNNLFLEPFSSKKEDFCSGNDIMQTGGNTIREGMVSSPPSLAYPCLQSENEENPKHPTEFNTFFRQFDTSLSPTGSPSTFSITGLSTEQCDKMDKMLEDLSADLDRSMKIVQKKIDCIDYKLNDNLTGYDSLSITPLEEQLKEQSNATYVPFIYYLSVSIVLTFLIFSGK